MGRASKTKGSVGEIEVRDLLREWWSPVEPETKIVRTPASGGWNASAEFAASGDLMVSPGSAFPFSVEVKRREGWSPVNLFAGRASPVWQWWAQACRDAEKIGRRPLLWVRRSRAEWIVVVSREDAERVGFCGVKAPRHIWDAHGAGVEPVIVFGWLFLETDPRAWIRRTA